MSNSEGPRDFGVLLAGLANGRCNGELSRNLHALVRKIQEESSARLVPVSGELTLKLSFKADPSDETGLPVFFGSAERW